MEQQSRQVGAKALEIYHSEMNSIISSVSTKDLAALKKTQQKLEGEIRKYILTELKGFSRSPELADGLLVLCFALKRNPNSKL